MAGAHAPLAQAGTSSFPQGPMVLDSLGFQLGHRELEGLPGTVPHKPREW